METYYFLRDLTLGARQEKLGASGILLEFYWNFMRINICERKLIIFCSVSLLVLDRKSLVLVVSRTNKRFPYFFKLTFQDYVDGKNEKYGFLPDISGIIFLPFYVYS